jgi:trimethylamine---corrinoid protein Co-methyltransferase
MLAGASTIYGAGMLESGVTFDLAQLVLDHEVISMAKHARAGIRVGDATTAIDEIMAVGPGGHFLECRSTLEGVRALSTTALMDRNVREEWELAGSPEVYERAREMAKRLLEEHRADALPDGVAEEVRAMVEAADRDVGADS